MAGAHEEMEQSVLHSIAESISSNHISLFVMCEVLSTCAADNAFE